MKKYTKNYIGKGTENANLYIIKVTLKMDLAAEFIYEKDGHKYLSFEISQLKEADMYDRTHTCYVSRLQKENITETSSLSTVNESPGGDLPDFNPIVPGKVKKPRGKKEMVTA